MSRSRLSRCLLPAVLLAALAPTSASAQPLAPASVPAAPASVPACLPTCGSDAALPVRTRQDRPNHTVVVALTTRTNQAYDAGLATHRLDLSTRAATTAQTFDKGLAAHRLDLSVPTDAAATARPACLPTCGSASVAPRTTPVRPSAHAKANA